MSAEAPVLTPAVRAALEGVGAATDQEPTHDEVGPLLEALEAQLDELREKGRDALTYSEVQVVDGLLEAVDYCNKRLGVFSDPATF